MDKGARSKEEGEFISSIKNYTIAANINPAEDKEVFGTIQIQLCYIYEIINDITSLIDYQDKTI